MTHLAEANDKWIPLQVKVFTRWFNTQLKLINEKEINSIIEDLSNGVALVEVVQFLIKKNAPRPWKKNPTRNIDMVQNCDLAIEMLQNEGIEIIGISGKDVNDKNEKLILGLIWSFISHYSINQSVKNSTHKSSKNDLLTWAIEKTNNYPNVSKFMPYHLAICALLDSYYPDKIDFKSLNINDIQGNMNLASDVMKELGIPLYIYQEDVINSDGHVDNKTLLTQLSAMKTIIESPQLKQNNECNQKINNDKPKPDQIKLPASQKSQNQTVIKSFSPDDPEGNDILSYGATLDPRYNYFSCENTDDQKGYKIMYGNKDNYWEASENENGITQFKVGFSQYSIVLKSFVLHTGSEKYQDKVPKDFYVLGFDTHKEIWDILFYNNAILGANSSYLFDIPEDKQAPHRIFSFLSSTGTFGLAYIKLYGDIIEETDLVKEESMATPYIIVKKNFEYSCLRKEGQYTDGIFQTAMKDYTPSLYYFIDIRSNGDIDKNSNPIDFWGARNKEFRTVKLDKHYTFSIIFLHSKLYMTGYQIRPTKDSMTSWAIVGYQNNNNDKGVILDHKENYVYKDEDLYYSFDFLNINPGQSFRIIRILGLNGYLAFHSFDVYGKTENANELKESDYTSAYSIPEI